MNKKHSEPPTRDADIRKEYLPLGTYGYISLHGMDTSEAEPHISQGREQVPVQARGHMVEGFRHTLTRRLTLRDTTSQLVFLRGFAAISLLIGLPSPLVGQLQCPQPRDFVNYILCAQEITQFVDRVTEPLKELSRLYETMQQIRAGENPTSAIRGDWRTLADAFAESARTIRQLESPATFDVSPYRVTLKQLRDCSTRDTALRKLDSHVSTLESALERGRLLRQELVARADVVRETEQIRQTMEDVAEAIIVSGLPYAADVAAWDWFALRASVRGPLSDLRQAIDDQLAQLDRELPRMAAQVANLRSNAGLVEDAPCSQLSRDTTPEKPTWLRSRDQNDPARRPDEPFPNEGLSRLGPNDRVVLILIDVSGSMAGSKIEAAKRGAIEAIRSAVGKHMWFGIMSFGGTCDSGVRTVQTWTKDADAATRAVSELSAGGGTPLAPALRTAARSLGHFVSPGKGAVVLLADGENSCGNVHAALDSLLRAGLRYHHETIGVGVSGSASADLRTIAERTGGSHTAARDASEIQASFRKAFDNLRRFILDWRWN